MLTTAPYLTPADPPSKRHILESALRLFARRGLHSVSVREIAAEAGYTNPALFKFFATKDALASHLFERCYLRLYDDVATAVGAARDFHGKLRAIVSVYVNRLDEDRDAVLFVEDHLRDFWPQVSPTTRRKSILGLIRRTLELGVAEGAVSSKVNAELLVATLTGTLQQFARMHYFGEFEGKALDHSRELMGILRRAVGP